MTTRPLKVLVLADSRAFHTERIVRKYRAQGVSVLLASLENGPIHHFHLRRRGPIRPFHYAMARRQVRAIIKRYCPDVINAHFASGYGHLAALANGNRRVPLLTHLWGSDILLVPKKSYFHKRKVVRALRASDHIIADSAYLLDAARAIAPIRKAGVVPWGLERQWVGCLSSDRTLGRPVRVIIPRSQAPVYNNEFLLSALAPLLSDGSISATFADFGPEADRFRKLVAGTGLPSVEFYQRLPRDDYLSLASRHDLYLSASRSDSSPASLIEAMGLGLIPIAADIPGVREWLDDHSGFLFEQDNAADLVAAVKRAIGADNLITMRQTNQHRVKREAVFEDNVAQTIRIMEELRG